MPVSVVVVKKTGELQEKVVKEYNESTLYMVAGFKSAEGFALQTIWSKDSIAREYSVSLYAKPKGNAGQENKYDFPPPVDSSLYFGSCVLVATMPDGVKTSLSVKDWKAIYEHLFGGFEDIGSEDSEESEDDLSDPDVPRTKEGYVKDGFIVDDDDDEDSDFVDEDEESSIEAKKKKKSAKKAAKPRVVKPKPKKETVPKKRGSKKSDLKNQVVSSEDVPEPATESTYLECSSELSEEAYVE
jgi:hypothetical protein